MYCALCLKSQASNILIYNCFLFHFLFLDHKKTVDAKFQQQLQPVRQVAVDKSGSAVQNAKANLYFLALEVLAVIIIVISVNNKID